MLRVSRSKILRNPRALLGGLIHRKFCYRLPAVVAPLDDEKMFNRSRELECISMMLMSSPQLSILTGPVNSGKTRLIERVLSDLPKRANIPTPVHLVNLRKGSFHSVGSLVNSFSVSVGFWLDQILSSRSVSVSLSAGPMSFSMQGTQASPIDKLNCLLENVANCMPSRKFLRGAQLPVFVVDEANRLRTLLRDPDGQAALESLFEWFILHTKKKRQFQVILSSSDSFFNLWVERFVGPSRYTTYVLGHLDKSEAEEYLVMIAVVLPSRRELHPNLKMYLKFVAGACT